jgi:hypothetical protein
LIQAAGASRFAEISHRRYLPSRVRAALKIDLSPFLIAHGGKSIEDPSGLRESNLGAMHLSYVRDPDGKKLCAIFG